MSHAKKRLLDEMIKNRLKVTGEGAVTIRRRRAFNFIESGQVDNEGRFTVFGQVFQQLKTEQYQSFQKTKVDAKVFNVTIVGEGAQDAGGPFRDCITNMCKELATASLPLLIRTANNKNNHG